MKNKNNRKEFRLNDKQIQIIENRNKVLYPTETSFIESAIFKMEEPEKEDELIVIKRLLRSISTKLDAIEKKMTPSESENEWLREDETSEPTDEWYDVQLAEENEKEKK